MTSCSRFSGFCKVYVGQDLGQYISHEIRRLHSQGSDEVEGGRAAAILLRITIVVYADCRKTDLWQADVVALINQQPEQTSLRKECTFKTAVSMSIAYFVSYSE